MKAFEDFLLTVLCAHIIVVGKVVSLESHTCKEISNNIVSKFVKIKFPTSECTASGRTQTATPPARGSVLSFEATSIGHLVCDRVVDTRAGVTWFS